MSDFKRDLDKSAASFKDVVWPAVQARFKGDLVPVESMTDSAMAKMIDLRSGIDALHLSADQRIRGIACRVQAIKEGEKVWRSFTIRYQRDSGAMTEYEKRKRDMESKGGWLYPYLTIQAYTAHGGTQQLLCAAVTTTEALIQVCDDILENKLHKKDGGRRRTGNAEFFYINWSYLEQIKAPICFFEQAAVNQ